MSFFNKNISRKIANQKLETKLLLSTIGIDLLFLFFFLVAAFSIITSRYHKLLYQSMQSSSSLVSYEFTNRLEDLVTMTNIVRSDSTVQSTLDEIYQPQEDYAVHYYSDIYSALQKHYLEYRQPYLKMAAISCPRFITYTNENIACRPDADLTKELIALAEGYRKQLDAITSFDGRIAELSRKKDKAYAEVLAKADVLSQLRKRSAQHIEQQMKSLLVPLGMPNVRFEVELTRRSEPDAKGMDSVTFLFSANKNGTLQNVASIASGGEIARVMLSLKAMIAGAVKLPTIIFDEIDTGVSGSIAEKMAFIMQDMGKQNRQVISITHLPQIAARGTTHYKVYKEDTDTGTNSHIRQLSDTERIDEIANMLSGAVMTDAARDNARALLNMNKE